MVYIFFFAKNDFIFPCLFGCDPKIFSHLVALNIPMIWYENDIYHYIFYKEEQIMSILLVVSYEFTTMHSWYDGHSISISACEVWEKRTGIQVSKREFHTYIHLDYVRVKILSCIKKKKKLQIPYIAVFLLIRRWLT